MRGIATWSKGAGDTINEKAERARESLVEIKAIDESLPLLFMKIF